MVPLDGVELGTYKGGPDHALLRDTQLPRLSGPDNGQGPRHVVVYALVRLDGVALVPT